MRVLRATLLFTLLLPSLAISQLTTDQKLVEFNYLADLFAKRYAPYEWKKTAQQFDMLELAPWLDKVRATRNDLEFFDVEAEYLSRLNDGHVGLNLPTNFVAQLNFLVDIYDGKLLVDTINRQRLPIAEYGFVVGYELVSIDGVPAAQWLERMLRYSVAGNPRSTRRYAAQYITFRPQTIYPFAPDVPEISTVVFRRPDGQLESYRIPWTKAGVPMTSVGKIREFTAAAAPAKAAEDEAPAYMNTLLRLENTRMPVRGVRGIGSLTPEYARALGPGFTPRLGRPGDPFFSGVFVVGPYRVGLIRIPDFQPASTAAAVAAFASEIAFFQANTDGLVVDVTRNPGGFVSYNSRLLSYLFPDRWKMPGREIRATSDWIIAFSQSLEAARAARAPAAVISQYQALLDAVLAANRQSRGRTDTLDIEAIGLEREPARAQNGTLVSYRKPLLVLIDEMSASAADSFAAAIQDNGRAPLFGWRTMGLGGSVFSYVVGPYTYSQASLTESIVTRAKDVVTPDFPTTRYIENVGVRPDIEFDYMTASNLERGGADFVEAFLLAMYQLIEGAK